MNASAVYPGTFDPVTLGHQDVIARAARIVDHLVVAVAAGSPGKQTLFTVDERIALLREVLGDLPNVSVESFDGLLVAYAASRGIGLLIRGVRAFSDFEYEFRMALMNRKMAPAVETLFLMPNQDYSYVSSSLVREVAALGGDCSPFVAPPVVAALAAKFGGGQTPPRA